MKLKTNRLCSLALAGLMFGSVGRTFARPATAPASQPVPTTAPAEKGDHLVVTRHSIQLDGKILEYLATAGTIQLKDQEGKPEANFFFVAYQRLPEQPAAQRPITYLFNGGPGAASVWLHLGAAGPRRIVTNADGTLPPPPYRLEDNPYTWLDDTDLVFIDPVGTGFSRAAPGQKPSQFFGLHEDVASVGDFIRLYATRYDRWTSPTFLAGESYGTTRAAALSKYLLDRYGMSLNGIALISSVLNFETIDASPGNDIAYALALPSYTAIALYHHKLNPTEFPGADSKPMNPDQIVASVRQFAIHQYLPLLAQGKLDPEQARKLAEELSHFTSLPVDLIERANYRIDPSLFEKNLLASEHEIIGRFDARMTAYQLEPTADHPVFDPSLSPFFSAYSSTFSQYVRTQLNYQSDLPYEVLSNKVWPWNFGGTGLTGYLNVTDDLRDAMAKNPHMKVLFVNGEYDLATPMTTARYTVNHLNLSPALSKNIRQVVFPTGHMVYQVPAVAEKLHEQLTQLIQGPG